MSDETKTEAIEPEILEEPTSLAHPGVPTTVDELASLEDQRGIAIVEQRTQILETLRIAALRLSMPSDWVLFKTPDGIITGFLSDTGCDRIKKLFGIQIDKLSKMDLVEDPDTHEFAYRITGEGHCGLTGEHVYDMEGIRYSTEPFAQQKPEGIQRHVAVQKAARANLDGGITRELAGLKSVPVEELTKAWEGSWRKWEMCSKGRGFGSRDTRLGRGDEKTGGIDPQDIPVCDLCQIKLTYRAGKKEDNSDAWFGCPTYSKHPETKVTISLPKLKEQLEKRKQSKQGNDQ